jgi:integrase
MNQMSFEFGAVTAVHSIANLVGIVDSSGLGQGRKRDLISALHRVCAMAGKDPAFVAASPQTIRDLFDGILPAAHGITGKTLNNIRSNVRTALVLAGLVDQVRGRALKCPVWCELASLAQDHRAIATGLATFMGFCSLRSIESTKVTNETVQRYLEWLEDRTIHDDPKGMARQVPLLWTRLRELHPELNLPPLHKLSFQKPRKIGWEAVDPAFRADAECYLQMRADPDPDDDDAPLRPLAASTLRQIREYLRLAYDAVVKGRSGKPPAALADLVQPDALKLVIAAYRKPDGSTTAFLGSMVQCLLQVGELHVKLPPAEIASLKKRTRRYRHASNDLTDKNKATLRHFDDGILCATLFRLPDQLMRQGRELMCSDLAKAARLFQAGLAIGILLNAPMRAQNLIALHVGEHFRFGRGKAPARILIPAAQTKSRRIDLAYELAPQLTQALQWYRLHMLPALQADSCGRLFVMPGGKARSQPNLSDLIKKAVADHLGIHMTPHQFRHLAANLYLDQHPEDFETVRQVLGHSFTKTTHIYAGRGNERGSRVYSSFVTKKSEKLRRRHGTRGK